MGSSPEVLLETPRLVLRRFELSDAPAVERYVSQWDVAATTTIPHPYPAGAAEQWVSFAQQGWDAGTLFAFAMVRKDERDVIGCMSLHVKTGDGGLKYWVAPPFWNLGYASEAAREVVRFGFEQQGLTVVAAGALTRNRPSTRVMEKAGLRHVKTHRGALLHHGAKEDADEYVLTRKEWLESLGRGSPAARSSPST